MSHTADVLSNKDHLVEEANKLHEAADGDNSCVFVLKLKFNLQQQTTQLNFIHVSKKRLYCLQSSEFQSDWWYLWIHFEKSFSVFVDYLFEF